jgi:hypothetical protein
MNDVANSKVANACFFFGFPAEAIFELFTVL